MHRSFILMAGLACIVIFPAPVANGLQAAPSQAAPPSGVTFEGIVQVLQVAASVAIVATFFVHRSKLRTMQETGEEDRRQSKAMAQAANALHLAQYLHSPELYGARKHLLGTLAAKPYASWSDDDKTEARLAIGAYDVAGILARCGAVSADVIPNNWGASIVKCHSAAFELVEDLRRENGYLWWDEFLQLSRRSQAVWNMKAPGP